MPRVWILKGIWNPETKQFEIWVKTSGFWMVRFSNQWDYSYSHTYSPNQWKPDQQISILQKVWNSNVSGFWMVGFQTPNIFKSLFIYSTLYKQRSQYNFKPKFICYANCLCQKFSWMLNIILCILHKKLAFRFVW